MIFVDKYILLKSMYSTGNRHSILLGKTIGATKINKLNAKDTKPFLKYVDRNADTNPAVILPHNNNMVPPIKVSLMV